MNVNRASNLIVVVAVAVLIVMVNGHSCTDDDLSEFQGFVVKYDRVYENDEEFMKRLSVFCDNLHLMKSVLLPINTTGVNEFADVSVEEFRSRYLMSKRRPPNNMASSSDDKFLNDKVPTSYDWRQHPGVVTPVKNQGTVGTCWACSATENIESVWALAGNPLVALSVEQMVDCASGTDLTNGIALCGVFGGWPYLAYEYVIQAGGMETNASYPYCCGDGDCYPCAPKGYNKTACGPYTSYCDHSNKCNIENPVAKITSWTAISKNEVTIAQQLISHGPLSVLMDATWLQFYKSGIWKPGSMCSKTELDHAVLLVGFGVSSSGEEYWIVKNSWGASWGMDGYFWLARGQGECGINTAVTTAIV